MALVTRATAAFCRRRHAQSLHRQCPEGTACTVDNSFFTQSPSKEYYKKYRAISIAKHASLQSRWCRNSSSGASAISR